MYYDKFQVGLQFRYIGGEVMAAKAAVRLEMLQPGGQVKHFAQQLIPAGPTRQIRGMHRHPENVDEQEALVPLDPYGDAIADMLAHARGADRLVVEDWCRRSAPPSHGPVGKDADLGLNQFEDAVTGPQPG